MDRWITLLLKLDRRWIFLLMGVAVVTPIIFHYRPREFTTPLVQNVFDKIESLPAGARVVLALDFEPGSRPELEPMAKAWLWHCAKRRLKMIIVTTWITAPNMLHAIIEKALVNEYPELRYGEDYVFLGWQAGLEIVIRSLARNLKETFPTDHYGASTNELPLTAGLLNFQAVDLILSCSAGHPGTKEWIQYCATPYGIPIATGCTGVQAPLLFPYYPKQMIGMLGAIKGAAEYEAALATKYPEYGTDAAGRPREEFTQGLERMGPQLIAHCLILMLIVLGNLLLLADRWRRRAA